MDILIFDKYLKENLSDEKYQHSINVSNTAEKLAGKYGVSNEKAEVAGLLHDATKCWNMDKQLLYIKEKNIALTDDEKQIPAVWHQITAKYFIKDTFGIEDEEILNAVLYHTTGRPAMGTLEKIIYLADCIEPMRDYPGVEIIRKYAFENLDKAMLTALNMSLQNIINKGGIIDEKTVSARNYYTLNEGI